MDDFFEDEEAPDDYDEASDPFADGKQSAAGGRIVLSETLRKLRGKVKPVDVCVVDIETYKWEHPYLVGFYDPTMSREPVFFESRQWTIRRKTGWKLGRKLRRRERLPGADCIEKFLRWYLTEENVGKVCYAHNGGNFDFIFFLRKLVAGTTFKSLGYRAVLTPLASCLFRIAITHPDVRGKWLFSDSVRLLPMRLDKVGETFGVGRKVDLAKELKCQPDKVHDVLALPRHQALARRYNRMDLLVLYRGVEKFQSMVNDLGGNLRATAPSTSLDVFRRKYQPTDLYLNKHLPSCPDLGKSNPTCEGCGHAVAREVLFGGRTEIYIGWGGTPRDPLYYFDKNSMYASVMKRPMPVGQAIEIQVGGTWAQVERMATGNLAGFIKCDVEIPPDTYLPPLPMRLGGKLIFPVGRITGRWSTVELALLKELGGRVTKVHHQVWYPTAPFFDRFVDAMWALRDRSRPDWSPGWDAIAKLLVNANFGKWGQRPERFEFLLNPGERKVIEERLEAVDEINTDLWMRRSSHRPEHVAPQISSWITSLARVEIWQANMEVLRAGGRIFYSDTDSVICQGAPWKSSKKLGEMKLEHIIDRAQFILPKAYRYDCAKECPCGTGGATHIKAKGMGPGLGDQLDIADWMRLTAFDLPLKHRQIVRRRLTKWRESMNGYYRQGLEFPRVVQSRKGFGSTYDKREVCPDGVNTMPLWLEDGTLIRRWPSRSERGFATAKNG